MARIEFATEVLDDFDRLFDHMAKFGTTADAPQRIHEIIEAVDILARSPLIGRRVKSGDRELVIGRGTCGYVALYRFLPAIETVFVMAIRSRREAGHRRDG